MQLSLGSVTSKPCEATAAENYSDRIFALTPSASTVAVTADKDNVFQMCFVDPNQGTASAQYIAEQKLGTKIAVIWKNDDVYSTGIHDKFVAEAKTKGLQVVSDNTFTDASANDFSVQLNDAKSKGADLVFLPMYYQPASLILTQANAMGYAPKFFGVDGMDGILTMEGFDPKLAEGVMLLTPFNADATDEKTASFVKKYKEQFGETPNQFAADAYDCVYAYKQALENAGATPDMSAEDLCDKMIEQFTSMTFDGLTGEALSLFGGQMQISKVTLVAIAACVVIMVALMLFTGKSKVGTAMRAVSEDKGAAQLMGINVNTTISITFAIGSGLAAIAGVLLCSAYPTLMPTTGSLPGIKAFTAAVFGGIGSIPGAFIGGILLGIIEIFAKAYISTQLSDAIVFAVLIVVLLVKPDGLLGKHVSEKV